MTRILIKFALLKQHLITRYERSLQIQPVKQPSKYTCWATCYKMVGDWDQQGRSFCSYVHLQTENCGNCETPEDACDRRRPIGLVTQDWKSLGFKKTQHFEKRLTLAEIRDAIRNKRPVQAFVVFPGKKDNDGHLLMITGTSRTRQADTSLLIADPSEKKIAEFEYSQFLEWADWKQTWVVEK